MFFYLGLLFNPQNNLSMCFNVLSFLYSGGKMKAEDTVTDGDFDGSNDFRRLL